MVPTPMMSHPAPADAGLRPDILPTDTRSTFTNSGEPGVNRLVALGSLLLVDNIGRNFEIRRVAADASDGPDFSQQARYDVTIFPGEDAPSVLDVDVHGAFITRDGSHLVVCNHFGRVRAFEWPLRDAPVTLTPVVEWQLPGDTERVAFVDDAFILSSPRGEMTPDRPQPGILLATPLTGPASRDAGPMPLEYVAALTSWGTVTALAVAHVATRIAVATADRCGLFELTRTTAGVRLGTTLWERAMPVRTQWLAFTPDDRAVLAGGYDDAQSDPDGSAWNACRGGRLQALDAAGTLLRSTSLPDLTAWGYGSDALTLAPDGHTVYAIDRLAGLHAVNLRTGAIARVSRLAGEADEATAAGDTVSLGIGHCEIVGGYLYAGHSRGGYRLFRYRI